MLQSSLKCRIQCLFDDWVIQTNGLCLKSKSIIMCERMTLSEEQLMVKFSCFKWVNFSYAGSVSKRFVFCITVLVFLNSKEMIRKSFSLAYLCRMLLLRMLQLQVVVEYATTYYFELVILLVEVCYFFWYKVTSSSG